MSKALKRLNHVMRERLHSAHALRPKDDWRKHDPYTFRVKIEKRVKG